MAYNEFAILASLGIVLRKINWNFAEPYLVRCLMRWNKLHLLTIEIDLKPLQGNLYATARKNNCNKLVLAQHLDDCAESFLMSAMHNGFIRSKL